MQQRGFVGMLLLVLVLGGCAYWWYTYYLDENGRQVFKQNVQALDAAKTARDAANAREKYIEKQIEEIK